MLGSSLVCYAFKYGEVVVDLLAGGMSGEAAERAEEQKRIAANIHDLLQKLHDEKKALLVFLQSLQVIIHTTQCSVYLTRANPGCLQQLLISL